MLIRGPDGMTVENELAWLGEQTGKSAKKPRAKLVARERMAQRAVLRWLELVLPPGSMTAAADNEAAAGSKDPLARARYGMRRKASGIVTGWPDLVIVLPAGRVVWLEMKAQDGRLSEAQARVHAQLRTIGHHVGVAVDVDTARRVLLDAGVPLREAPGQPAPAAKVRTVKARCRGRSFALPADRLPPGWAP